MFQGLNKPTEPYEAAVNKLTQIWQDADYDQTEPWHGLFFQVLDQWTTHIELWHHTHEINLEISITADLRLYVLLNQRGGVEKFQFANHYIFRNGWWNGAKKIIQLKQLWLNLHSLSYRCKEVRKSKRGLPVFALLLKFEIQHYEWEAAL